MNDTDLRIQWTSTSRSSTSAWLSDASMNDRDWPSMPTPGARLEGIGRAILRHFWLIVFTLVCLNCLAIVIVRMLPLGYAAGAVILIGPREAQMMDMKTVITGQSGESDVIESEMQILHSRRLARRVVEGLRLEQNPDFNPSLAPPGLGHRIISELGTALFPLHPGLRPSQISASVVDGAADTHKPPGSPARSAQRDDRRLPAPPFDCSEGSLAGGRHHPGRRRSDPGGRRNQERDVMRIALLINFVIPLPVLVAEGTASRRGLSNCRCLRV
jgi:hypothetical protein